MIYPHFIELHDGADPLSINVDRIEWFADETVIMTNCEVRVLESYEDIKRLVRDSGALIAKQDPRLENLPVDWYTLTSVDMIGEPVWNSNSRRWMLVIDSANDRSWVELINHAGGRERWGEHELRKFPLYRMRREA